MSFVACTYHFGWWTGMTIEVHNAEREIEIKFLHPKGPASSFYWLENEDIRTVAPFHLII